MMHLATTNDSPQPALRPFCMKCNWRKGGPDSWNGFACKCGETEQPIKRVEDTDAPDPGE